MNRKIAMTALAPRMKQRIQLTINQGKSQLAKQGVGAKMLTAAHKGEDEVHQV